MEKEHGKSGTESGKMKDERSHIPSTDSVPSSVDFSEDWLDEFPENSLDINLSNIQFSFENPPKNDPWNETFRRRVEGKNTFYHPHYHPYPKKVLPYELLKSDPEEELLDERSIANRKAPRKCARNPNINYKERSSSTSPETVESSTDSEKSPLTSGKEPVFGEVSDRLLDEGKIRKSLIGHPSSPHIVSRSVQRPSRKCKTNPNINYKEESESTSSETVESSTDSENQSASSDDNDDNCDLLPIDPKDDIYAVALERLASGETSTLQVESGPCLPVSQLLLQDPLLDLGINLQPGPSVPFESIIAQHFNFDE